MGDLGCPWDALGGSWGALGVLLEGSGCSWGPLGVLLGVLGVLLEALGVLWGCSWELLGWSGSRSKNQKLDKNINENKIRMMISNEKRKKRIPGYTGVCGCVGARLGLLLVGLGKSLGPFWAARSTF